MRTVFSQMDPSATSLNKLKIYPEYGELDSTHLPLRLLMDLEPYLYAKLEGKENYAIVRSPFDRFGSSLAQYLRDYIGKPIHHLSKAELYSSLNDVIRWIGNNQSLDVFPPKYIHFQKQVDYISHKNLKLINNIYLMEDLNLMITDMALSCRKYEVIAETGIDIRENKSIYPKNNLVFSIMKNRIIKNLVQRIISSNLKELIRPLFFKEASKVLVKVFSSSEVRNFIEDFYKEDIVLYESYRKISNR